MLAIIVNELFKCDCAVTLICFNWKTGVIKGVYIGPTLQEYKYMFKKLMLLEKSV